MNIWKDPERWVDADLTREEWIIWLKWRALGALAIAIALTVAFVLIGVMMG